jgi:Ca2+-transporting ATPase
MSTTSNQRGLSNAEAESRFIEHGPNAIPEHAPVPVWKRFLRQFQSPLIYILLCALITDAAIWLYDGAHGFPFETISIALILILNATLGAFQEHKAEAALAHLKSLTTSHVWVVRERQLRLLPSTHLVPGDVVRIEAGERIPADGALIEGQGWLVDEAVLTGESLPVEKEVSHDLLSGTLLVRGKGYLEVHRTGRASAMGRLAELIGEIVPERTPLERRMADFGRQIARVVLLLAGFVALSGLLMEGLARFGHTLLFAVALAVAAVPEGLPAVLSLTLAMGVLRMARRNAVVRRLSAVEALGSVTVIATDKTGTLTENHLAVRDVDAPDLSRALRAIVLANDAETGSNVGDPLEVALLHYASTHKVDTSLLREESPRRSTLPFDSAAKLMRVTVVERGDCVSYVKGAPEVLLRRSRLTQLERENWEEKAEGYGQEGFRVIGLAWRSGEGEEDLEFLGLVLLWDPPRSEVPGAIRQAQKAGIRVVMVTGDHPATALSVAREVGIPPSRVITGLELEQLSDEALENAVREANVFARVAPEHKLRLVEALKRCGETVAMTGDGVNDAPALKRADVSVAMGKRGSDVAREVADLVLLDDNFASIIAAVEEGRSIYANIQKFIRFLFSTNLAETSIVVLGLFGSVLLGLHNELGELLLPVTAVQLLWINIITDGPPALALGLDKNPGVMRLPPRSPQSPLLDRPTLRFILVAGATMTLIGGAILVWLPRQGYSHESTRSVIFLYVAISQLSLAYAARRIGISPQANFPLHLTIIVSVLLQLVAVFSPWLQTMLGLVAPDSKALLIVGVAVLLSWGVAEIAGNRMRRNNNGINGSDGIHGI